MEFIPVILNALIPLIVSTVFGVVVAKMKKIADTYESNKSTIAEEAANKVKDEITKTVINYAKEEDKKLQDQITKNNETLEIIKEGVKSSQGIQFRKHCEELLDSKHEITVHEYNEFVKDYNAYKALEGNGLGDMLFKAVVAKFESSVIKGDN